MFENVLNLINNCSSLYGHKNWKIRAWDINFRISGLVKNWVLVMYWLDTPSGCTVDFSQHEAALSVGC